MEDIAIGEGDLTKRIDIKNKDEIGMLQGKFPRLPKQSPRLQNRPISWLSMPPLKQQGLEKQAKALPLLPGKSKAFQGRLPGQQMILRNKLPGYKAPLRILFRMSQRYLK